MFKLNPWFNTAVLCWQEQRFTSLVLFTQLIEMQKSKHPGFGAVRNELDFWKCKISSPLVGRAYITNAEQ